MTNRILFLYSAPIQKTEFTKCEPVFKAILRKFRKTFTFLYLQIDYSLSCREQMQKQLFKYIGLSDAVIFSGNNSRLYHENDFFRKLLGLYATQYCISGRSIICPVSECTLTCEEEIISEKTIYKSQDIARASEICAVSATKRRQDITVCTNPTDDAENLFFQKLEYTASKNKHIKFCHVSTDEMIWECINFIPSPDVVFTTEKTAKIIAMHASAFQKMPDGYILHHTDCGKIYRRQFFRGDGVTNSAVMSLILAFAAVLENEFNLPNAAFWLRKSASLAFSEYGCEDENEFLSKAISKINKPMRKPRGIHNESTN